MSQYLVIVIRVGCLVVHTSRCASMGDRTSCHSVCLNNKTPRLALPTGLTLWLFFDTRDQCIRGVHIVFQTGNTPQRSFVLVRL